MPTRVLIAGGGAREHALAWKLAGEPGVNEVIVAPGSEGIAAEPRVRVLPGVDPLDGGALVRAAQSTSAELVVIGPEAPLAAGVADALRRTGVATFGPGAAAARIETSKAFCHDIAEAAGVRMARAQAFDSFAPALAYARSLAAGGRGVVIKADGLAAGKGVTVCDDGAAAEAALAAIFDSPSPHGEQAALVVVEERLFGREASVIAICDGRDALALPAARDHKRLGDGDMGPNTGGMGAYSPVPDLDDAGVEKIVVSIHRPILAELARRGSPFRGALYAGLMLTDDGPVLLECNARFGDPETQVILPQLGVALGPLLLAAARGELAAAARPLGLTGSILPATREAGVGIVVAAAGYPGAPKRGDPIEGIEDARSMGALVFHGGTAIAQGRGGFVTAGGRILTVVGRGADLGEARRRAEDAAEAIHFTGLQRRHDIAADPPRPFAAEDASSRAPVGAGR
jgi:phosphoribosylamine--glycine ligase